MQCKHILSLVFLLLAASCVNAQPGVDDYEYVDGDDYNDVVREVDIDADDEYTDAETFPELIDDLATASATRPQRCNLPVNRGFGSQNLRRFFYNRATDRCQAFRYRGRGGNANRFLTRRHCRRECRGAFYATCQIQSNNLGGNARGTIYMEQIGRNAPVSVQGFVWGLPPGRHGLAIHRSGTGNPVDCNRRVGPHYNPLQRNHGGVTGRNRHEGDFGNIVTDELGNSILRFNVNGLSIVPNARRSIIGRSFVIHARRDDLGLGGNRQSLIDGNAGRGIACCTIRSRSQ